MLGCIAGRMLHPLTAALPHHERELASVLSKQHASAQQYCSVLRRRAGFRVLKPLSLLRSLALGSSVNDFFQAPVVSNALLCVLLPLFAPGFGASVVLIMCPLMTGLPSCAPDSPTIAAISSRRVVARDWLL